MDDPSADTLRAHRLLSDAASPMIGALARQIAFSPEPKAALRPCRVAVSTAFEKHFQHLSAQEREWMIHYVLDRAFASALEILSLNRPR